MNRPVRTGKDSDEARARILEAAEEQFRRAGYHRTSVADIAAGLGMSPANIYRFFPSRDAINESICGRVVNEVADIASAVARTNAPAMEKLDQLLTAVHHRNKTIIREGVEAGEFDVDDAAEAARAVRSAFMPFFHPILIEHCVEHGEDTEAGLRDQIRFILKALGKSG